MWYEHNPVTVSYLSCDLRVNGVSVATASAPGSGPVVVVPPQPISYTAGPLDVVVLCESYELVDAHGGTTTVTGKCAETMPSWVPPRQVNDVYDYYVAPAFGQVDPPVCAALDETAPTQVRDLVRIEPGGDVYVAETFVYDCPPYE
ncbi:MAG TPA: hypothetical protein VNA20_00825 [Frankiaceae bacterium]|nr:hypothetical protein [Frankiaceae bacterium]